MVTTEKMIASARARLIESVLSAQQAASSEDKSTARETIDALTSAMPQMPSLIEDALSRAMGSADARIFTREDLRRFLAVFAIDLLFCQLEAVRRWFRVRVRRAGRR